MTHLTMLELIDGLLDAAVEPGFNRDDATALTEIKRRLVEIYCQGSLDGRIQSLIGDDVLSGAS